MTQEMQKLKFSGLAAMAALAVMATSCQQAQHTMGPAQYATIAVQEQDQEVHETYAANIKGRQDVAVMPQVGGTLTHMLVNEGDKVRRGQVLFIIDQVPYRAQLETAKANVEAAKASVAQAQLSYDSKKELREKNVVSDFELQTAYNSLLQAKASMAQANANLVNAQNSLSYTEVKSPADGVVGILPYRVGALVSPQMGTPLTTVSDNNKMHVYFSMNEGQILSLTRQWGSVDNALKNMPAISLVLSDDSLYNHEGHVVTISGVIDQGTGTAQLRAEFPNPEGLLMSGTSGKIIMTRTVKNAIVIPQAATFEIQDRKYVYTIVDGKASSKPVSVSRLTGGQDYLVNKGLEPGDVIIAEGVGLLREGTPVQPKAQAQEQAQPQQ